MKFKTFSFDSRIGDKNFPLRLVRMAPQNSIDELHNHQFTELVIVYEGEGDHYTSETNYTHLSRGNVFIVPQEKVYHRYDNLKNLCLVNILFEKKLLPLPLLDIFTMPGFNILFNDKINATNSGFDIFSIKEKELSRLLEHIDELELLLKKRNSGYQFASISLFMRIMYLLSKAIDNNQATVVPSKLNISKGIGFLHSHFCEKNLTIEKVASVANMSMSTLLRHFKQQIGSSPKEYLLKLRIKYACEMLFASYLDISEISMRCGFEDSNYFSRIFKRVTKSSPREFRKNQQQ